ncbi:unnamed protein product [Owenia fusiformis]|uniref:Ion transport domain-containing protein n=1 Tax=Owenia fusiformis TaxID=6347 RepID=A0A8S4PVH3_OWEFU|nr:unnamed protein product [Owenia fusiformis]
MFERNGYELPTEGTHKKGGSLAADILCCNPDIHEIVNTQAIGDKNVDHYTDLSNNPASYLWKPPPPYNKPKPPSAKSESPYSKSEPPYIKRNTFTKSEPTNTVPPSYLFKPKPSHTKPLTVQHKLELVNHAYTSGNFNRQHKGLSYWGAIKSTTVNNNMEENPRTLLSMHEKMESSHKLKLAEKEDASKLSKVMPDTPDESGILNDTSGNGRGAKRLKAVQLTATIASAFNSKRPNRGYKISRQRMGYRHRRKSNLVGVYNESFLSDILDGEVDISHITLTQAAREGLVYIIEQHLKTTTNKQLNELDNDLFTPLHHAARYNRVEVMQLLLDKGADPNIKGLDDMISLHLAVKYNCIDATEILLKYKANLNAVDNKGKTALHYSTKRSQDKITQMLLMQDTCNVNAEDEDLQTPLHFAAECGSDGICSLLLSCGADLQAKDINDMTPLMYAALDGHVTVIDLFLKQALKSGMKPEKLILDVDNEGATSLHLAVQNGKLKVAEILLMNGAPVDFQKARGMTALMLATIQGYKSIVQLLLDHKASVLIVDEDQMTVVHKAALYNQTTILPLLLRCGADLNAKDIDNFTPLLCASWKGHSKTVRFLLDHGAQIAEVDCSLKTCLHWATECNNYETLTTLLQFEGMCNLIERRDQSDQTVLHYAATLGNIEAVQLLLDKGARPGSKDQEDKTPLHLAAESNNVEVVRCLINLSGAETNDDDIDGRTPLLLACLHGHSVVVRLLLVLGADISSRDDDQRSALMLAAMNGHVSVLSILLDNHCDITATDRLKNTALHYACMEGQADAAKLLLDNQANVKAKNVKSLTPLDMAIEYQCSDVAVALLKHNSWRSIMEVRDKNGYTPIKKLIQRLPDAAQVLLDNCLEKKCRNNSIDQVTMTLDFQYIDPGPDDICCKNKRYCALYTMVEYQRGEMLSHPLCQNLMSKKWVKFGMLCFILNLLLYVVFLVLLTIYTSFAGEPITTDLIDNVRYCPIYLNATERQNETLVEYYIKHGKMTEQDLLQEDPYLSVLGPSLTVIMIIFLIRELFKVYSQKLRYFTELSNWVNLELIITTFIFTQPLNQAPCLTQWRAGYFANFAAWAGLILYLRRIDMVGIYVIMFIAVFKSLLKVVVIFLMFLMAFTSAFYILLARQSTFTDVGNTIMRVFVMSLGEIDYLDNFADANLAPFEADANFLLMVFLFLVPIVLMNLMVGIAVGDIDKIQQNAYIKRLAMQVDLLCDYETKLPKFLQRKVYYRSAIIKPNTGSNSNLTMLKHSLLGSSRSVNFIQAEERDKTQVAMDQLHTELKEQRFKVSQIQLMLEKQNEFLHNFQKQLQSQQRSKSRSLSTMFPNPPGKQRPLKPPTDKPL